MSRSAKRGDRSIELLPREFRLLEYMMRRKDQLLTRAPLRLGTDRAHAVDAVWLLMDPAVYCRLTGDRGWSPEAYRDWFADAVARLLTDLP